MAGNPHSSVDQGGRPSTLNQRKRYLPLVSPRIFEAGPSSQSLNCDARNHEHSSKQWRRASTPNQPSDNVTCASDYFQMIKNDDVGFSAVADSDEEEEFEHNYPLGPLVTDSNKRRRTTASYHHRTYISPTASHFAGKGRAMSVPQAIHSSIHPTFKVIPRPSGRRRESGRAQQLALLASQARLASTGTSSVQTALRTEKAVKGAVVKVAEEARDARPVAGLLNESDNQMCQDTDQSEEKLQGAPSGLTSTWYEALASPVATVSFFDTASQVARGWANGFYAFESRWVHEALGQQQNEVSDAERLTHTMRNTSTPVHMEINPPSDQVTDQLLGLEKVSQGKAPIGSGKLVDVLTNFAALMDSRKEGCRGLERLAQDARQISSSPLPPLNKDINHV